MSVMEVTGRSDVQAADPEAADRPVHRATDLVRNGRVAQIVHNDQIYTLRITRLGKLILTK
ncbi:MAG: hemin uptake protein HemP [Pseudomonadota bacterium]